VRQPDSTASAAGVVSATPELEDTFTCNPINSQKRRRPQGRRRSREKRLRARNFL